MPKKRIIEMPVDAKMLSISVEYFVAVGVIKSNDNKITINPIMIANFRNIS